MCGTKHNMADERHTRGRARKRQEINRSLKYLVFFTNFVFWACSLVSIGIGIFVLVDEFRPVLEALDFFLNPAILFIIGGCIVFFLSFFGCTGALRENVCMLKFFGMALFMAYLCLVVLAFVIFLLFYSDSKSGISMYSLLQSAIKKYSENDNIKEVMDAMQTQLKCCGATNQGYMDWNLSPAHACNSNLDNQAERLSADAFPHCSVPHSCCIYQKNIPKTVTCGASAMQKSIPELEGIVYTEGCLKKLRNAFEGHAVIIGGAIGGILIPVCVSITLSNILWKQIEKQRWRLERQAVRDERWNRRMKRLIRNTTTKFTHPDRNAQLPQPQMLPPTPIPTPHISTVHPPPLRTAASPDNYYPNSSPSSAMPAIQTARTMPFWDDNRYSPMASSEIRATGHARNLNNSSSASLANLSRFGPPGQPSNPMINRFLSRGVHSGMPRPPYPIMSCPTITDTNSGKYATGAPEIRPPQILNVGRLPHSPHNPSFATSRDSQPYPHNRGGHNMAANPAAVAVTSSGNLQGRVSMTWDGRINNSAPNADKYCGSLGVHDRMVSNPKPHKRKTIRPNISISPNTSNQDSGQRSSPGQLEIQLIANSPDLQKSRRVGTGSEIPRRKNDKRQRKNRSTSNVHSSAESNIYESIQ